jgi:hypothetical protein
VRCLWTLEVTLDLEKHFHAAIELDDAIETLDHCIIKLRRLLPTAARSTLTPKASPRRGSLYVAQRT